LNDLVHYYDLIDTGLMDYIGEKTVDLIEVATDSAVPNLYL